MPLCQEFQDLYPAFVLDAVNAQDRKNIEEHIADCPLCAEIVEGYCSIADLLPFAAPTVEPPPELKARVLAAAVPRARVVVAQRSIWQELLKGLNQALTSPAFAAMTLLLVIGLGAWNLSLQNQIAAQITANQKMTSDLTSERAMMSTMAYADAQPKRLVSTDVAPQAVGRLYTASELNAVALIVYDMPALKPDQVYQIWLIDPNGARTSGGTFTVDERGRSWVYIRSPQPLTNFTGIGITVEPTGGSPKPTGPKMMESHL